MCYRKIVRFQMKTEESGKVTTYCQLSDEGGPGGLRYREVIWK